MRNYGYILMAALLAGAVSCNERIGSESLEPIRFTAGFDAIGTKAFMNPDDLSDTDNGLTIWAFEGDDVLIEGETAGYTANGWALSKTYYWKSKDYTFFSYLSKDKDGKSLTTTGTNPDIDISGLTPVTPGSSGTSGSTDPVTPGSTRSLKVNAKTFNFDATNDPSFDFCYSAVVLRPQAKDKSPVDMSLKHLYTAIGFSVHNYTSSSITLKEVTVVGLKNKKSAVIDFDDDAKITYPTTDVACTWTNSSKTLYSNTTGTTITSGGEYANVVGTSLSTDAQYFMFWPQTSAELAATGWTDNATAPTGGAYLKVVYNQGGSDITRYAKFPQDNDGTNDLGWPGGTKRMMQLAFREEQITLKMQILDWEYSEPEIKYDDEVTVAQVLKFDSSSCTIDEDQHKVFFNNLSTPVIGRFRLSAPSEAAWIISKQGDFDAFEIDDVTPDANGKTAGRYGDHLDRNYGTVNETDGNSFTLYPMPVSAEGDYSIQLSFSIRYPDGESYSIDDKVQLDNASQPVKWTIVFTK